MQPSKPPLSGSSGPSVACSATSLNSQQAHRAWGSARGSYSLSFHVLTHLLNLVRSLNKQSSNQSLWCPYLFIHVLVIHEDVSLEYACVLFYLFLVTAILLWSCCFIVCLMCNRSMLVCVYVYVFMCARVCVLAPWGL